MVKMDKEHRLWITKLQILMNNAPNDLWLFTASNTLNVMQKKKGKRIITKNGNMD